MPAVILPMSSLLQTVPSANWTRFSWFARPRYHPSTVMRSPVPEISKELALSQVGQQGGQPYWSWYGFGGRVEWCACFVSRCAEECGYIEAGIISKFSLCSDGVNWFKAI